MLQWVVKKIVGTQNQRMVRRLWPTVEKINAFEREYQSLSDDALRAKTDEFKKRHQAGESLDALLPEAFAAVKNACRRFTESKRVIQVRGQKILWEMIPFDVQLVGGMVLHQGKIAEMATGEGKTLVATLPSYLNALTGRGVHIVTVNDYLAARDSEWMGEVYQFLGLTVGCIQNEQAPEARRAQYACDITYGTNSEFGFDYLRDNGMASSAEEQVQRGHAYAIVDEVDSILIDEARTPLIISGPSTVSTQQYNKYKPQLERLIQAQNLECSQWAQEARALIEADKVGEAGRALYKIKASMPRNKQLLKLLEEPAHRRAMEDAELALYQDTRRSDLYKLREEALFTVDEKSSESDLSERGREFLNPKDPDAFILPDLVTRFHEIDMDASLSEAQKLERRQEAQQNYEQSAERLHNIAQLLRAYCLFERDVHYVIQDNKVVIVDEFTGRLMSGRRWSDGLHQAVEAKEGVKIDQEQQTLATITIQNYFRLYDKLAGMTGTAETEAHEFHDIYKLGVVGIPTNRPISRTDKNDSLYKTRRAKYNAIVEEIKVIHAAGQPLLVGTLSVESSELLSRMLRREGIPHSVLNAKYHQQEAEIVARAGQHGAVTIATNMAGRGTDIKLGEGVAEVGGLYVLGTERFEARRIDRQLRGRCARQGDPGMSRFYVSFEDDLMRNFADSRKISSIMTRLGMDDDEELAHPWLNKSVETAQKRVEQRNYVIRKHVLQYDDVMNQQRTIIYALRNQVLHTAEPRVEIFDILEELVTARALTMLPDTEAGPPAFLAWINATFPIGLAQGDINWNAEADAVATQVLARIRSAYELKVKFEDAATVRGLERLMVLSALDRLWQEHLYAMDGMRSGIQLRAFGQKDPLVEYKREAFDMFEQLMNSLKEEVAQNLFRSGATLAAFEQLFSGLPHKLTHEVPANVLAYAAMAGMGGQPGAAPAGPASQPTQELVLPTRRDTPKVGRNDPCPCGSGKKYKNCHGAAGA